MEQKSSAEIDENTGLPKSEKPKVVISLFFSLLFIFIIWIIKFFEVYTSVDLGTYGVYPREVSGLTGILFSPLIHADFSHLVSNTITVFVLLFFLFYSYTKSSFRVLAIVYIGSGLAVWLTARPAYHIGASGLIYGFVSYLFFAGLLRRDTKSISLALLVTFLYGGLIWGVLPTDPKVSFESHLSGAVIGLICALMFKNTDPLPKKYEWEDDEETDDSNNQYYTHPDDIDRDELDEEWHTDGDDDDEDWRSK
jgi:membrane associated rhomboid family serine protease